MMQKSVNQTSTISTTSFCRVRGFSETVMNLLDGSQLTSRQVCDATLKEGNYVRRYLYNLKNYGLIEKNEDLWSLSDKGTFLLSLSKDYTNKQTNKQIKSERRVKEERKKSESCLYKKPLQVSLSAWGLKDSLSDCEKEVVELLIKHFNETNSKYIFFEDPYTLSEKTGFNVETLQNALQKLRQDNIIYLIKDRTQNCWKIGLKKAFVELLKSKLV